jgi:hypothetical protein
MSFEVLPALVAGLLATVVMSAMMALGRSSGLTSMPPMPLVIGTMMSGDEKSASRIGLAIHYGMMGTLVFGLLYGALLTGLGGTPVLTGAAIGLVHGLVVGLVALPMMPAVHPRMSAAADGPRTDSVVVEGGVVTLTAPGVLGSKWGAMTPMGLVVGHVVYGVVAAVVYSWLA